MPNLVHRTVWPNHVAPSREVDVGVQRDVNDQYDGDDLRDVQHGGVGSEQLHSLQPLIKNVCL